MADHRLITGGGAYLPFAQNVLQRMRAVGQDYASRNFVLPGARLMVRTAGEDSFIYLSAAGFLTHGFTPNTTTSEPANHREVLDPADEAPYDPPTLPDEPVFSYPDFVYSGSPPFPNYHDYGGVFTHLEITIDDGRDGDGVGLVVTHYSQQNFSGGELGYWETTETWSKPTPTSTPEITAVSTVISNAMGYKIVVNIAGTPTEVVIPISAGVDDGTNPGGTSTYPGFVNGTVAQYWAAGNAIDPSYLTYDPNPPFSEDYNNDLAAWQAAYDAEFAAWDAARIAALDEFNTVTHPAWEAECAALVAAALAAQAAAQATICSAWTGSTQSARMTNRTTQLIDLAAEIAAGMNTAAIAKDALTVPAAPSSRKQAIFPIEEVARTGSPGGQSITYRITDYSQDPPTTRDIVGTVNSAEVAGDGDSCDALITQYTLDRVWVGSLPTNITAVMVPNTDFVDGYFVSGTIAPFYPWKQDLTFEEPPAEYLSYIASAGVAAESEPALLVDYTNDVYIPGVMVIVVFEYECFDTFTNAWVWTSTPNLLTTDPVKVCEYNPCTYPDPPGEDPGGSPRAVRLATAKKFRRIGTEWTTPIAVDLTNFSLNESIAVGGAASSVFAVARNGADYKPFDSAPGAIYDANSNDETLAAVDALEWSAVTTVTQLELKLAILATRIAGVTLNFPEAP